jgi:hypothetical protein
MTMPMELADLGAVAVVVAPLVILSVALLGDWSELKINAPARVLDWPQGVQEEEPVRWQIERLSRPGQDSTTTVARRDRARDRSEPARV